jgi:hypothetical protein
MPDCIYFPLAFDSYIKTLLSKSTFNYFVFLVLRIELFSASRPHQRYMPIP